MLETYFSAQKTLARLRTGPSGPHIDGFADALEQDGYSSASAVRYLRAAAHLGHFLHRRRRTLADVDAETLKAFRSHLSRCHCPLSNGGTVNHHVFFGAKRFHHHLCRTGVCQAKPVLSRPNTEPALIASFREWFQRHRGATAPTLRHYCRGAADLLNGLGEDVSQWDTGRIRAFVFDRAKQSGASTTQHLITAIRAFLRFLSFHGLCRINPDQALPGLAHWRLASLPPCLTAEDVARVIATCDGPSVRCLRDRAILLLLVRLGLRASDVARLRLTDLEWERGTLRVVGKGRYEVRLPLPQDAGDALLQYLIARPELGATDHVFLRHIAPFKPFVSNHCVSGGSSAR
jgi:site-specific recombinase XerD